MGLGRNGRRPARPSSPVVLSWRTPRPDGRGELVRHALLAVVSVGAVRAAQPRARRHELSRRAMHVGAGLDGERFDRAVHEQRHLAARAGDGVEAGRRAARGGGGGAVAVARCSGQQRAIAVVVAAGERGVVPDDGVGGRA